MILTNKDGQLSLYDTIPKSYHNPTIQNPNTIEQTIASLKPTHLDKPNYYGHIRANSP